MDNIRTVLRQVRAVIMTSANLGPRTVIAVVRASLADIDIWQKNGVSRDEIASVLTERAGVSITLTAFDKALYRARKELKSRLHNSTKQEDKSQIESGLHNPERREEVQQADYGLHNPKQDKLVEDMGGNKEFLSDTDFKKIGDEAKKVASSFKGSVGNKKGF